MYLVKLFENPVPTDGTAKPLFDGGVHYGQGNGGIDGPLRALLKDLGRLYCGEPGKRYSVQVWDEHAQAWYVPSSGSHFPAGHDGLIPMETVTMVGSLRL